MMRERVSLSAARAEFPLLRTCVYLNSNSTGAVPRGAKAALEEYWRTVERWRDEAWDGWWNDLNAYAAELAELIGAPVGSVVCDANVSTLLSRVMSCFDFHRERPRVVTSDLEFPAIPHILRAFERYGAVPVVVPSRDRVEIDAERLLREIDERTRLVCVSHATFETGALLDVEPIVRRAREVGALVALDAYQSAGVVPLDVTASGVDFVLGGAHKWLCGSCESAFLYIRPALLPELHPAATGWIAAADPMSFAPPTGWAVDARRFAGGTPAVLPAQLSRPGLAILRGIGADATRRRSLALTDHIIARADEAGLAVASPRAHERRGGIVALRFPGAEAVARELIASGFVCSYRGGLRIAPHFYNTDEEIDRFMHELTRRLRKAAA
jgi:selenocysteine lyase/cysteine desulfurase